MIGCDLFWSLLKLGRLSGGKYNPTLQETELGWVVAGPVGGIGAKEQRRQVSCNLSINQDLHDMMARFWEVEELTQARPLSSEETECERIFSETTCRNHEGRFVVNLPLKQSADCLGESRFRAENSILQSETENTSLLVERLL